MRGNELDFYLSVGYYRTRQDMFTCRFVRFEDRVCPVHWLRIALSGVQYGKSQRRLLRLNEPFSVEVRPFTLSDEINALYARYRKTIAFDAPDTVGDCLFDGFTVNAFDTQVVEVRDGHRLVAAGIFDDGAQSIAGIMNFYDPDYRRHSLGKYLMLQKINHARLRQKTYYYPGYIVGNYPKFDYKLFPGEAATEVFDDTTGVWLPFSWETVRALSAAMLEE